MDWPAVSAAIVGHLTVWLDARAATTVLGYAALDDEPDLDGLVGSRAGRRHRWLLTRTPEEGPLTVHRWDTPRERHRFGFSQPVVGAPAVPLGEIGVVLVPGLAFGPDGRRLGHGGGHYDRLLAGLAAFVPRVGVTTDALVRVGLPVEAHDVAMTHLATGSGVRACAPAGPSGS